MPTVYFIDADGNQFEAEADSGTNVMEAAVDNFIDGIVGECGGVLSCATCHCYVDEKWQAKLDPPSEQEEDMLDMAVEPKDNSRLSCQIELTDELDGLVVHLPKTQF
ncbi:2Fe-2S iron-sulfur cluster binding domain-containing protein [Idiomarina seosinensis]|uniref:2Fe-2S iron-sulfur cluster-binding protein n=1 Tax=Idiomarina seosinensis TaxID=281739 RepID=UPI00384D1CA3